MSLVVEGLIVCQASFSILNCKRRKHWQRTEESETENMESKYTINANYYLIYKKLCISFESNVYIGIGPAIEFSSSMSR